MYSPFQLTSQESRIEFAHILQNELVHPSFWYRRSLVPHDSSVVISQAIRDRAAGGHPGRAARPEIFGCPRENRARWPGSQPTSYSSYGVAAEARHGDRPPEMGGA